MPVIGPSAAIAALKQITGLRLDPLGAYNFHVEIEGVLVGGFMEVRGLGARTDVLRYKEGGMNAGERVFPGRTSFTEIELVHGMTLSDSLYNWYADVIAGNIKRKNASVYMLSNLYIPLKWWNFMGAFPIAWTGPAFNAGQGGVAVETLRIAYETMDHPTLGI